MCPVRALGQHFIHIHTNQGTKKTFLSTYFDKGIKLKVTAEHISQALKVAVAALNYPEQTGIPIDCVDMHSLRSGGANALALSGFTDMQIQKMVRWKGATFKEYMQDELACFSAGMLLTMKRQFGFLNVASTAFYNVMDMAIVAEYNTSITKERLCEYGDGRPFDMSVHPHRTLVVERLDLTLAFLCDMHKYMPMGS